MENLHKTGGDIYSFKVGKVRLKFISAKIKSPYHNIYILLKKTAGMLLKDHTRRVFLIKGSFSGSVTKYNSSR